MVVRQYIMLQGESPTYILNEDTQPVIRAIGVSHTPCKDEFDRKFDLTDGVFFFFFTNTFSDPMPLHVTNHDLHGERRVYRLP